MDNRYINENKQYLQNSLFFGAAAITPLVLLAIYGVGTIHGQIPILVQIGMYLNYLRYSMEVIATVTLDNRGVLDCPPHKDVCPFRDLKYVMKLMGIEGKIIWVNLTALMVTLLLFKIVSYFIIKQRLKPNKMFRALHVFLRVIHLQFLSLRWYHIFLYKCMCVL